MRMSFLLVGISLFSFFSHMPVANAEAKRALVYRGPGACDDGCWLAAYQMALRAGLDPQYVAPNEPVTQNLFKNVVVWIQPGGKSSIAIEAMTPALKTALFDYVKNGGGYVGFCAGAFAATTKVGTTGIDGLGIMPGRTTWYSTPKGASVLPIRWNGKMRSIYWEGGPYLSEIPQGAAEVTAFYPNGSIASARSIFGKGRVYVTGLHPEAPQWWREFYGLADSDGGDEDLVMEMITWARADHAL